MSQDKKPRHRLANPKGGINLHDDGGIMPAAIKDITTKIASNLIKLQFSDLLKTSGPSYIHTDRTYIECTAFDCLFAQKFLTKAAATHDPIERIKLILCMYVGGHHINPEYSQLRAPLNPIIGETVQRVLSDGTKFYAEQLSHHPPITGFYLEGPDESYRFSGHFELKAWLNNLNSLGGTRAGKQVFSFSDGGLITIKDAAAEISGLTFGDRTHNLQG